MWAWLAALFDRLAEDLHLDKFLQDVRPREFVEGLLFLVLFILVARLLRRLAARLLGSARVDAQVSLLVTRLVFLATLLLGAIGFFSLWLGNLTLVFGSFGIFALAFGLAFQDILKNFLAGIFLLLERPFRIGDEIAVGVRSGVVEDVQVRTTTLRTLEGEEVLIPNSLVYTEIIVNRSRYPTRLFTLMARVPAQVRLDGLTQSVEEGLKRCREVATEPAPRVGLQPSIDGGLILEVRYWLDYRRHDPLAVQAALGRQIYQAIQRNAAGGAASPAWPASDKEMDPIS